MSANPYNQWGDQPNYTIKAAAKRTEKSTRTIERWVRAGMKCRQVAGVVIIDHHDLMAFYRSKLVSNPNRTRRQ